MTGILRDIFGPMSGFDTMIVIVVFLMGLREFCVEMVRSEAQVERENTKQMEIELQRERLDFDKFCVTHNYTNPEDIRAAIKAIQDDDFCNDAGAGLQPNITRSDPLTAKDTIYRPLRGEDDTLGGYGLAIKDPQGK